MNKLKNVGGISFLSNFDFIRYLKLYTFSLHAICAYMGYLKGYKHINEAVNDKEILELLVSAKRQLLWVFERKFPQFMDEECKDYLDKVIDRFKELPDLIIRVSRHVEMKLGYDERLIGPARWIWEENGDVGPFIIGIAMALNYGMFKERGKDIDKDVLDDKQAKELQNYLETQGIDFVLKRICGVGLKENDPLDIKLFYLIKDKFLSLRLQTNCLVKAISEVSNRSLEEVSKYFDKLDKLFKEGKLYIDFKEAIEVMEEKGIPFDGIFVKRERIENGEVYWHTIISNKDAEDKKEEDYNPLSQVIDKLDNIKHWVGAKDDIQPLSKIQKVKDSIVEENKALNNLLQGIKEKMGFSEKAIKDLGSELIIPEDFIDKMLSSMPTRHIEAESVSLERLRIQVIGGYFMVKSFLKEGSLKRPYISITNPIGVHYTEVVFVFEGRDNIYTDLEDIEKIINKLGGNIIQKWGIDYKISSEKIAVLFFEIQKINEKRGFTQKEIREKHLSCVNIYPVEIQNFYQDWTKKIDICKSVVSKEKVILSDIGELLIAVNGRGLISTYPYYEREKRLDLYRKTFVPKKPKSLLEGLKDCNERILEILNKKKTEGSIMISVFGPEASGKDYFSLMLYERLRESLYNLGESKLPKINIVIADDTWFLCYSRRKGTETPDKFDIEGELGIRKSLFRLRKGEETYIPFFDDKTRQRIRLVETEEYLLTDKRTVDEKIYQPVLKKKIDELISTGAEVINFYGAKLIRLFDANGMYLFNNPVLQREIDSRIRILREMPHRQDFWIGDIFIDITEDTQTGWISGDFVEKRYPGLYIFNGILMGSEAIFSAREQRDIFDLRVYIDANPMVRFIRASSRHRLGLRHTFMGKEEFVKAFRDRLITEAGKWVEPSLANANVVVENVSPIEHLLFSFSGLDEDLQTLVYTEIVMKLIPGTQLNWKERKEFIEIIEKLKSQKISQEVFREIANDFVYNINLRQHSLEGIEVVNKKLPSLDTKIVVFDWDDTIFTGIHFIREIEAEIIAEILSGSKDYKENIIEAKEIVELTQGMTTLDRINIAIRKAKEKGISVPYNPQHYLSKIYKAENKRLKEERKNWAKYTPLVLGIRELLEVLNNNGVKCYVVSGGREAKKKRQAKEFDLDKYFEDIFGSPYSKNKEETLKKIIGINEVKPEQVVMIGDGVVDMRAAKEAGCIAIGLSINKTTQEKLIQAGADIIIKKNYLRIDDIMRILLGKRKEDLNSTVGNIFRNEKFNWLMRVLFIGSIPIHELGHLVLSKLQRIDVEF
ncbi:MAG: HAD-IA family hydrolase, partial [Candidatus Omnitrophica bacterium]|nr:HAD-IA family hydrolase [Candidatus Omnitrophota bacterium]